MKYADIHTHILFNVDDGAQTQEESLAMLDVAYQTGTRAVFFTPHTGNSGFCYERANEHLLQLKPLIIERYPDLKIYGGSEILFSALTLELLLSKQVPTLADSSYPLIEFDPAVFYGDMMDAVRQLANNGFTPIIAHAERYECMHPALAYQLIDMGAYIQLNARSVLGKHGRKVKRICKHLLQGHLVHFIASDAHNAVIRSPDLSECAAYIEHRFGEEYVQELFCDNALAVVNNQII